MHSCTPPLASSRPCPLCSPDSQRPLLKRRTVLASMLALATAGAAISTAPWARAAPRPGSAASLNPWANADATARTRLLDRLTWGNTAEGAQALPAGSVASYLATQLRPGPAAPLPREAQAYIDAMTITRTPAEGLAIEMAARQRAARALPSEDARKSALKDWQQDMRTLQREAADRFVLRALYSPTQLREKMTWFWMNHFNIFAGKGPLRAMVGDYEDRAIRPHALGRFRDLLGATVRHPAMLIYLDNAQNSVGRINENYARELMELHTLGVDGGYTQADVQELARVLTGVGISLQPPGDEAPRMPPAMRPHYVREGLFVFNPQRHDWGTKTLLGEPLQAQGLAELNEALDRLAHAPATARFITHKMASFMVGDTPSPALLQTLAHSFERSDGDIATVLQVLFDTPEFQASLGQRFRDPVHYVLAGLRLAHGDTVVTNTAPAVSWLQRLAEPLYGRATPDGYPLNTSAWAGSGQMNTRFEIARAIGAGASVVANGAAGMQPAPDGNNMRQSAPMPSPPAAAAPPRQPPPLAQTAYVRALEPTWSPATRDALAQATSPREWNLLFLASPEFMRG